MHAVCAKMPDVKGQPNEILTSRFFASTSVADIAEPAGAGTFWQTPELAQAQAGTPAPAQMKKNIYNAILFAPTNIEKRQI